MPAMQLTGLDWAVVAAYFLLNLGVGFYYYRRAGKGLAEFFVSGRDVPWWLAGTSMVATTFAADTPLAVTGMVARHGIAGNWLWWNLRDERHAHRIPLRAAVAPRRGAHRYRIRRSALQRPPGRLSARLPRALPGPAGGRADHGLDQPGWITCPAPCAA